MITFEIPGKPTAETAACFPFIGTAAEHLEQVEKAIDRRRKAHHPVADLLKRRRILVARCAALGVQHG
jgi:hypothetical protein